VSNAVFDSVAALWRRIAAFARSVTGSDADVGAGTNIDAILLLPVE